MTTRLRLARQPMQDRTAAERLRQKLKIERELSLVRQDGALFLRPDRLAHRVGATQGAADPDPIASSFTKESMSWMTSRASLR